MSGLKLDDPTVDVSDVEKYRLAFLMQFFVQHKRRFRFPRLRLQDLYQRVVKCPDVTAFCDFVARILRFLSRGDPDISIDTVDQALDRFTMEKRTPYRINMQRHRNGKPVHQLGPAARAALLDNLIESVYDEQPDFNFTAGFNHPQPGSNGARVINGSSALDTHDSDSGTNLFGDASANETGDLVETEDVNVLIKAGQDAQGCSYYYMDDLRLYRERPQSGISSQWDVAVGPTTAQWQAFILSLSRNEKECDLYCFLKQDLFDLVKQSLDGYELRAANSELDSPNLRAKEAGELVELRRRRGLSTSKLSCDNVDNGHLQLGLTSGLGATGPKSASPAFSGGHGACGIGSLGSTSSGAPLTPSSARTPTSAPPATASSGCLPPPIQQQRTVPVVDVVEPLTVTKSEPLPTRAPPSATWPCESNQSSTNALQLSESINKVCEPIGQTPCELSPTSSHRPSDNASLLITQSKNTDVWQSVRSGQSALSNVQSDTSTEPPTQLPNSTAWHHVTPDNVDASHTCPSPSLPTYTGPPCTTQISGVDMPWSTSRPSTGLSSQTVFNQTPSVHRHQSTPTAVDSRMRKPTSDQLLEQSVSAVSITAPTGLTDESAVSTHSPTTNTLLPKQPNNVPATSSQTLKHQVYAFDPSPNKEATVPPECCSSRPGIGPVRSVPMDMIDPTGLLDRQVSCGTKPPTGPATALVSPMIGIPDGAPALTQEQWENRKSKIAQLEKIHSTLSKSKSASTPGAVTAAAGAVLQQQQQQRLQHNVPACPVPQAVGIAPQQHLPGTMGDGGFLPTPYPPTQRPTMSDGYSITRSSVLPGTVPCEMAQREWDRLCMDYQREKNEPPGPRCHPPCRQSVMFDSNSCPVMPADPVLSSPGTTMLPSGPLVMEHSYPIPPRHYLTHVDGSGPPVMMVPPNNSNFTSVNSAYPPTTPGSISSQHYRCAPSLGHVCQEQLQMTMVPTGQKRAYFGSPVDPWNSNGSGPAMTQLSANDPSMTAAGVACPTQRMGLGPAAFGSVTPAATATPSNPANPANSAVGRGAGVTRAGGKKRKTVGSSRTSASAAPPASVQTLVAQQQYAYGKPPNNAIIGSMTPSKSSYPSSYLTDPSQAGFHPHRGVYVSPSPNHLHLVQQSSGSHPNYATMDPCFTHYPDMTSGPTMGRPAGASVTPMEGRRALTPKGGEMFAVGGIGPALPGCNSMSGSRISSNCGVAFPSTGLCGPGPLVHGYMHSPDASGLNYDMGSGLRTAVSCTQHLTSASLASLARLSQLSGPEGPYVSSGSSGSVGSNVGAPPSSGSYAGRSCHTDATSMLLGLPHYMPPQSMRGPPGTVTLGSLKTHDPDMAPSIHSKFGTQIYHGQRQSISAQSVPPTQPPPQPQQHSQQPPSIQVNNTFFNAQLNVQQMNYQHVSAPGSTGQMQIHFVQQQQQEQQQHEPPSGLNPSRSTRQVDPSSRMSTSAGPTVPSGPDYYSGSGSLNSPTTYATESSTSLRAPYANQLGMSEIPIKSDGSGANCVGMPGMSVSGTPTAVGYGNTSVQITPRTPHTIQYLPAVAPSHSESQHSGPQSYIPTDTSQLVRSKPPRNNTSYGFLDTASFSHTDMAMDTTRSGASFNSGSVTYTTQAQYPPHHGTQSQTTQSGYAPLSRTVVAQTSGRLTAASANWTTGSNEGYVESNSPTTASSFIPITTTDTGGRVTSMLPQSSVRANPSITYPSTYSGEVIDSSIADASIIPWSNDPNTTNFTQRTGISHQFNRQHSTANRQDQSQQPPPQMQQHSYRQQQYSQHHHQQQHQMFMSSSMSHFDGTGPSGQVQFVMSASASSSSMSAANVQASSSTTISGDVNHNATAMPPMPATGPVEPGSSRSSTTCHNANMDLKSNVAFDTGVVTNVKRVTVPLVGISENPKSGCDTVTTYGPRAISPHAPQGGGQGRMHWQPSTINPPTLSNSTDPYSTAYGSTTLPVGSGAAGLGQACASGFIDTAQSNARDMLGLQRSQSTINCDMSQSYSSSVVP